MKIESDNLDLLNISAAEHDTGLSKDTLRVWERRYGFPQPLRDAKGNRMYPREQIERLRRIKRLVDQGSRPGKIVRPANAEVFRAVSAALVVEQMPQADASNPEGVAPTSYSGLVGPFVPHRSSKRSRRNGAR